MKKTLFNTILGATLIVGFSYFISVKKITTEPPKEKQPNLLIIFVDQWRSQALGFMKKEPVQTPCIDKLAQQSFVVTQMVSNNPLCSPARAMLMTGQHSFKNHVYANANSRTAPDGIELQSNAVCWSDVLKANGYFNGYIGKWHLDAPREPFVPTSTNTKELAWNEWTSPERRHGFDYWYAYGTYDEHLKPMYWDNSALRDNFHYVNEWGPSHEAEKALAFLRNEQKERDPNKPFSLVVSINPPHTPYNQVPQKYIDLYKNISVDSLTKDSNIPPAGTEMGDLYRKNIKLYYAAIAGVDEQIGRILKGLKDLQLEKNTIVLFTADHGNCLGKHEQEAKNNIYEESLRVPLIVRWPGQTAARYDSTFLGSMLDIYPTLLDLMGLHKQIPSNVDGKSYASYFMNGEGERPTEQFILGTINSHNPNSGFRGIRTAEYKLAYVKNKGNLERYFFNLKKDPFELYNIYNASDERVIQFDKKLHAYLKKTNDPFTIN